MQDAPNLKISINRRIYHVHELHKSKFSLLCKLINKITESSMKIQA